jgi:hypothetical protein
MVVISGWSGAAFILLTFSSFVNSLELQFPVGSHAERKSQFSYATAFPDSKSNSSWSMFEQLIDHENPALGTFSQRYIYNWQFYSGPKAPIILSTLGEEGLPNSMFTYYNLNSSQPNSIDFLFSAQTISLVAEKLGAGMVMLEHRYYGKSWPVNDTTVAGMKYNTVNNSIADLVAFAQKVNLPFDLHGTNHASNVPWVLMGCSMAGALTSWTEKLRPGTFWAYWGSSATVLGAGSWASTIQIAENIAQNCSKDIGKVVDHIDDIGVNGTQKEQRDLKTVFGMEAIEHYDDFAWYVLPLRFESK